MYDFRATALNAATKYGHLEAAKPLIEHGADVDSRDNNGFTPLLTASRQGQLEIARLLLDHGADVNARKRYDITPLHFVLWEPRGGPAFTIMWRKRGCMEHRRTPKEAARRQGRHRVVEFLSGLEGHGQVTIEVRFVIQVTSDSYRVIDIATVALKGTGAIFECSSSNRLN
ncbi:Ankyrin repeat-containing domain protein [Lactarius tabidus]